MPFKIEVFWNPRLLPISTNFKTKVRVQLKLECGLMSDYIVTRSVQICKHLLVARNVISQEHLSLV